MSFQIAYFDRWQHPDGLTKIAQHPELNVTLLHSSSTLAEIWPAMAKTQGYYIRSSRDEILPELHVSAALLARCPNLLAIVTNGAGFDPIDIDACTKAGIIVANQSGGNKDAVAEHTLGMMLALSKRIVETDRLLRRERGWHRNDYIGHNIQGKTLGIIGLGNIGTRVAQLCSQLFAMRILAYDPYLTAAQCADRLAEQCSFSCSSYSKLTLLAFIVLAMTKPTACLALKSLP